MCIADTEKTEPAIGIGTNSSQVVHYRLEEIPRAVGFTELYWTNYMERTYRLTYDNINPINFITTGGIISEEDAAGLGKKIVLRSAVRTFQSMISKEGLSQSESWAISYATSSDSLGARIARRLLRGTIGDVDEESISVNRSTPSVTEQAWLSEVKRSSVKYGFKPFRTSPYFYYANKWRNDFHKEIFIFSGRYYFDDYSFEKQRAELFVEIPMETWKLDIGTTFHPKREASVPACLGTVRLYHPINKNTPLDFFIAGNVSSGFSSITIGLSAPWRW
jgi:hypothetical protein